MLLVYDGTCSLCKNFVAWFQARDAHKRVEFLACQDEKRATLAPTLTEEKCMSAMQLVLEGGRLRSGFDAVPFLLRALSQWWWHFIGIVLSIPGATIIGRPVYRLVASNRYKLHCNNDRCHI